MRENDEKQLANELMKNVENRLKMHVKKRKNIKNIVLPIFVAFCIISVSFNHEIIGMAQRLFFGGSIENGVSLAIQNYNSIKIDKEFNIEGVNIKFENLVADETGTAVTYVVGKEGYSLEDIQILDKDKNVIMSQGDNCKNFNSNEGIYYIDSIKNINEGLNKNILLFPKVKQDSVIIKSAKLFNTQNPELSKNIDIELPLTIKRNNIKEIVINKQFKTSIGILKLEKLRCGLMLSELSYKFIPNNTKNIGAINLDLQIKSHDKTLDIYENYGCDNTDSNYKREAAKKDAVWFDNAEKYAGYVKFAPIIYSNGKNLEIDLVSIQYSQEVNKEYKFNKNELPKKFDLLGNKFTVVSMDIKDNNNNGWEKSPKNIREYFSKSTILTMDFEVNNRNFINLTDNSFKSSDNIYGKDSYCGASYKYDFNRIYRIDEDKFQKELVRIKKMFPELEDKIQEKSGGLYKYTATIQGPHDELLMFVKYASNESIIGKKVVVKIR